MSRDSAIAAHDGTLPLNPAAARGDAVSGAGSEPNRSLVV